MMYFIKVTNTNRNLSKLINVSEYSLKDINKITKFYNGIKGYSLKLVTKQINGL